MHKALLDHTGLSNFPSISNVKDLKLKLPSHLRSKIKIT